MWAAEIRLSMAGNGTKVGNEKYLIFHFPYLPTANPKKPSDTPADTIIMEMFSSKYRLMNISILCRSYISFYNSTNDAENLRKLKYRILQFSLDLATK